MILDDMVLYTFTFFENLTTVRKWAAIVIVSLANDILASINDKWNRDRVVPVSMLAHSCSTHQWAYIAVREVTGEVGVGH
jgi:hypothetical protein